MASFAVFPFGDGITGISDSSFRLAFTSAFESLDSIWFHHYKEVIINQSMACVNIHPSNIGLFVNTPLVVIIHGWVSVSSHSAHVHRLAQAFCSCFRNSVQCPSGYLSWGL